jgi:uncharacterized protein (UPF0335 family)
VARKKKANESVDNDDDPIGDGSDGGVNTLAITTAELKQFIERWESLEADKKAIAADQKDLMSEAKGRGYDTKVMRQIIRERAADSDALAEFQSVLDLYKQALGMS